MTLEKLCARSLLCGDLLIVRQTERQGRDYIECASKRKNGFPRRKRRRKPVRRLYNFRVVMGARTNSTAYTVDLFSAVRFNRSTAKTWGVYNRLPTKMHMNHKNHMTFFFPLFRAQRARQRAARRRASVGALRIGAGRKSYSSRMMIYGRLFLRPCSSWYPLASTNMKSWLYGIGCPLGSFMSICARSLVLSSL